ncbi:MAG: DNA polymerase IV [Candidatus Peregrinibacteria bacterium Greene0416_19]|nr:MAG: DNA polymerase IV [Candidatus Peregrinibacteria bacterium Greene0416_19]
MIAHIDADAFFAAVLVRKHPHLRGKPLLALGMGGGCVISASYEAKAKGVKTGMSLKEALKLIPNVLRMPSDFHETALASQQIEEMLQDQCPIIEQMSVDEWFLDLSSRVGGTPQDLSAWAATIRTDVLSRTGLSVSVGVGPTKLLAKMASEYRKPGGITVVTGGFMPPPFGPPPRPHRCGGFGLGEGDFNFSVPHGGAVLLRSIAHCCNEQHGSAVRHSPTMTRPLPGRSAHRPAAEGEGLQGGGMALQNFLQARPAAAIPGIGRRRVIHTDIEGWKTAWDIAQAPLERISQLFGKPGRELQLELRGEPVYAVSPDVAPPKSVSRCRSFRATKDRSELWAHLLRHLEYTVLKMRRWGLGCQGISVWLRNDAYFHEGANLSLPQVMDTEEELQPYVLRCFERVYRSTVACTQIGIALWRLLPKHATQFSLFGQPQELLKGEQLQQALDTLHERFGRQTITRGSAIRVKSGTQQSLDMPVYE